MLSKHGSINRIREDSPKVWTKAFEKETLEHIDKAMELEEIKGQIAAQYEPAGYAMMSIGSSLVTGLIVSILMASVIATNMMYKL